MFDFFKSILSNNSKIDEDTVRGCAAAYEEMLKHVTKEIIREDGSINIENLIQLTMEKIVMARIAIDHKDNARIMGYLTGQIATLYFFYQILMMAHGNKDKEELPDESINDFENLFNDMEDLKRIKILSQHMWVRTVIKFQQVNEEHGSPWKVG